jgi:ABC-type multidrug transport system ATPase subunit
MTNAQVAEITTRLRAGHASVGERHVLRGVGFDVAPVNIFALPGCDGAGKTTVVHHQR